MCRTDWYEKWLEAKEAENQAKKRRMEIEDKISLRLELDDQKEQTKTHNFDGYKVKIQQRLNRSIDSERLIEIATYEGILEKVQELFRIKYEVNKKAWESTDDAVTNLLVEAITVKPGRPSYAIEKVG